MATAATNLVTQVELHLKCVNLPKMDVITQTDAFVVVSVQNGNIWNEKFRTQTIWNTPNPEWSDHILLDYHFEKMQKLKFQVFHGSHTKASATLIGSVETALSNVMGSLGSTLTTTLTQGAANRGTIVIHGQEVSSNHDMVHLRLRGRKLDRKNLFGFGKSDPFYQISQMKPDGTFVKVFSSETKMMNLNPVWNKQEVLMQRLCNGDMDRTLKVEVLDYESTGRHQLIGYFLTTAGELSTQKVFDLKFKPKKNKNERKSGEIHVDEFIIEKRYSFLQYIEGGCELNLMVAVDFTASNGHPLDEISLHRVHTDGTLNQYQSAIWSVGSILVDYDKDKMIPCYGFGGLINGHVSHCFPLNFNPDDPDVYKVQGIMDAYKNALYVVDLSGPTHFAEIVGKAVEEAKENERGEGQKYTILLIITDGLINDMDATIKNIVEGASLPLSIIIVGVGNADFSNMEVLDGDDVRLTYYGKRAERDIVQFVPFTEVNKRGNEYLAEQVLEEIPDQLLSYYRNRDIAPLTDDTPLVQAAPMAAYVVDLQRQTSDHDEVIDVKDIIVAEIV